MTSHRQIVARSGRNWSLDHGPFRDVSKLPERGWTLLVRASIESAPTGCLASGASRCPHATRRPEVTARSDGGVGPHSDCATSLSASRIQAAALVWGRRHDLSAQAALPLRSFSGSSPDRARFLARRRPPLPPDVAHDGARSTRVRRPRSNSAPSAAKLRRSSISPHHLRLPGVTPIRIWAFLHARRRSMARCRNLPRMPEISRGIERRS